MVAAAAARRTDCAGDAPALLEQLGGLLSGGPPVQLRGRRRHRRHRWPAGRACSTAQMIGGWDGLPLAEHLEQLLGVPALAAQRRAGCRLGGVSRACGCAAQTSCSSRCPPASGPASFWTDACAAAPPAWPVISVMAVHRAALAGARLPAAPAVAGAARLPGVARVRQRHGARSGCAGARACAQTGCSWKLSALACGQDCW
jgi:hypothetical protein